MAYYSITEMKEVLEIYPQYREKLYCRGFLLTNDEKNNISEFPFYGNWNCKKITIELENYYIYTHKDTRCYTYSDGRCVLFLVGHAYNPYRMQSDEMEILKDLSVDLKEDVESFWKTESELTGVFCIGYITAKGVVFSTDCAGMQLVYHGSINGKLFLTSHSKLVADLKNLSQSKYIKKLISNKFWRYWGTWLPGDLSPFSELRRMQPNCAGVYTVRDGDIKIKRYYPFCKIEETTTEELYKATIRELGEIMNNTMKCIAAKWPDKKISISVTGGRDSMTALACSKGIYDKFSYFSYISNFDESVDAKAAKRICNHLGLAHELYQIPDEWEGYEHLDVFKKVMECNAGCIGENNMNDLKKRLYFSKNPPCDIEVKSWVNEMGRGWYYNKYNKKKFPEYPYPSYWRAMHKVYISPWLIKETDKVFADYLKRYYNKKVFDRLSWLELYFWEFAWSGGEGVFLTSEHRVSYEITIPFNNRKYLEKMLTVPLEKRKVDSIPNDLITYMEPRIAETGIVIKDISHTNFRAFLVRMYLGIFSKIRF